MYIIKKLWMVSINGINRTSPPDAVASKMLRQPLKACGEDGNMHALNNFCWWQD